MPYNAPRTARSSVDLPELVPAGDHRDTRVQVDAEVVKRSEAGDLETLEDHRNPTSEPDSAISP